MLKTIIDKTRHNLQIQQDAVPMNILVEKMEKHELLQKAPIKLLPQLIEKTKEKETPAIIAEIKRASPSKGMLCEIENPGDLAKIYQEAGAAAISVLTEPSYFKGSFDDFSEVKQAVHLPVLRKDFIISTYQIYQSKEMKADIILLIAAALSDQELKTFHQTARQLNLQCLLEVHNKEELERVKSLSLQPEVDFIGINNRNLKTMQVDLTTTEKLSHDIPRGIHMISESGIKTFQDCQIVKGYGASGVLVGESIVTNRFPGDALRKLRGEAS
ncbi:MAG: indole-3-glycerol phosphate synthase TrpC [Tindallia sp. MSAO_Bac2]|nr:MAG: indole-3-glycerol phosphate synthase TrpC [Tindallia sp. MSAO_Bac2]